MPYDGLVCLSKGRVCFSAKIETLRFDWLVILDSEKKDVACFFVGGLKYKGEIVVIKISPHRVK